MPAVYKISTKFGEALPPRPEHSITFHLPNWDFLQQYIDNPELISTKVKSNYPRHAPFGDVEELIKKLSADHGNGKKCLPFACKASAESCVAFVISKRCSCDNCGSAVPQIVAFDFPLGRIWTVCLTPQESCIGTVFWQDAGVGISSRIARSALTKYKSRKTIKDFSPNPASGKDGLSVESPAFAWVKQRIADLLNRAPRQIRELKITADNVFLFPSGMAAIYYLQRYLNQSSGNNSGSTILFGFAFVSTPAVLNEYSTYFKWFGKGDNEELKQLERLCTDEAKAGRRVQALWLEFPSNPNIQIPDLVRVRELADKFGFHVIIDDTICSFCNVDLLDIADALVTSLTKSFSGYSDVMAGSVVLNPSSKAYPSLREVFAQNFVNELYIGDVEALEKNSRDYLERSRRLNDNAMALATFLQPLVSNASSPVVSVAYPSCDPNVELWNRFMRSHDPSIHQAKDFVPGYGCVLSIEFATIESTKRFFDSLQVHKGPHLGANLTLVLPYIHVVYSGSPENVEWAQKCGMSPKMIRISVGLEDTQALIATFKAALDAADDGHGQVSMSHLSLGA